MACNCKKINEVQDEYGTPEEETMLGTLYRNLLKVFLFIIGLVIGVVITPVIIVVVVYQLAFVKKEDRGIALPKMLLNHSK